jgi:hypothetical protein
LSDFAGRDNGAALTRRRLAQQIGERLGAFA